MDSQQCADIGLAHIRGTGDIQLKIRLENPACSSPLSGDKLYPLPRSLILSSLHTIFLFVFVFLTNENTWAHIEEKLCYTRKMATQMFGFRVLQFEYAPSFCGGDRLELTARASRLTLLPDDSVHVASV